MKKIKKIVAGILVLSLLFLCSACMMQGKKDDNSKWVMTKQTKSTVNEQGTEKLIYEIDYKYDSYGRKNYEVWSIMPGSTYVYSDFEYDGNGNVVSCKHNYKDEVFNINENSDCTYVYDNNNNLIKSTVSGTSSIDITTYKYDEKGNLICAEYSWTDTQYQDEDNVTHNYILIYENDICVSAEVIINSSSSEKQTYCLYNYSYDENGNKISEHQYKEVEDSSQGEIIEFNGKSYRLEQIVKYTYEQIEIEDMNEDLNTENNYNSNNENNFEEITTEKSTPLSEWGFNNIDEWGNGLVKITEYNLKEGYVVYSSAYKPSACEIRNGYFLDCDWNGQKFFPRTTQKYEVVSNDILYVVGDGNLSITSRKVDLERNFIVFKEEHYKDDGSLWWETWYVPYSLIDWDRGVEKFDGEYEYSYRYYLK